MARILMKNAMLVLLGWMALLTARADEIGQDAYVGDMKFVTVDGKTIRLTDFKGKFVVVNFWATWCPPCLMEIPDLVDFHEEHKDKDAVVLGVNYEDIPIRKLKPFIESQMITYPIVRLPGRIDGVSTPFGALLGLPTTYMIDPQSRVVAMQMGMISRQSLEKFIKRYKALHPHLFRDGRFIGEDPAAENGNRAPASQSAPQGGSELRP